MTGGDLCFQSVVSEFGCKGAPQSSLCLVAFLVTLPRRSAASPASVTSSSGNTHSFFFFFKDLIYLLMRNTQTERHRHRQTEKQAPCREPDAGLDPGSPGSRPGLQAALNHCTTGAAHDVLLN